MAKKDNNIEKSYKLEISEMDKEFKRMYQAASPKSGKRWVTMCQTMLMQRIWKLPAWRTNGYVMVTP